MNNIVVNGLITRITDIAGNGLEILNADLAFGLPKEDPVIKSLISYFNEDIQKAEYKYSPFDASSVTTKYEIKSRRNKYAQYPTTIIPLDKTERIKGSRLVFVFNFLDKLCYIEYTKDQFDKYEIRDVEAVRKGGIRTLKPHYYIPIKDLIEINI
tara:strand:+ start:1951 stop:2415 length:465 start_codon:yes stop_codon:yes gene_type:complete